jgi:hypothetical protein
MVVCEKTHINHENVVFDTQYSKTYSGMHVERDERIEFFTILVASRTIPWDAKQNALSNRKCASADSALFV